MSVQTHFSRKKHYTVPVNLAVTAKFSNLTFPITCSRNFVFLFFMIAINAGSDFIICELSVFSGVVSVLVLFVRLWMMELLVFLDF